MSFSIVIETENLAAGGVADLRRCLNSLAAQTRPVSKAREVLVLVGGHLDSETAAEIESEYPAVTLHKTNTDLTYLGAKRLGGQLTSGDIIVYADSDVAYREDWLDRTLAEMDARPEAIVVFSDTRIPIHSAYGFAVQATWMLPVRPTGGEIKRGKKFHLNNFAIRRDWLLSTDFDDDLPLFRNGIELWRQRLRLKGAVFFRIPEVMALHLAPRSFSEWWLRMLVLGADNVAVSDYHQQRNGAIVHRPSLLRRGKAAVATLLDRIGIMRQRVRLLIAEDPRHGRYLPQGIPIMVGAYLVFAIGASSAVLFPRAALDLMTAFEE